VKKLVVAGLVAAGLLLSACSGITSGTITAKHYEAAHDVPVMYCVIYDSKMNCRMWSWRTDHYDEEWTFDLGNEKGETGEVSVRHDIWDRYKIGDKYVG
jgi:hypothetical protein